MSHERLSDCSGSIAGKTTVRALTHSRDLGSACERRESIACARGLSTPSALSRHLVDIGRQGFLNIKNQKTKLNLAVSNAVRTETIHGLWNDQGMPVFTPGSNPRRLAAAAYHRG